MNDQKQKLTPDGGMVWCGPNQDETHDFPEPNIYEMDTGSYLEPRCRKCGRTPRQCLIDSSP